MTPRVLVIRGGAVGDFILTLPAIQLIRESISGCHLEILGYPGIASLAVRAGLADAVRSLEHRTMAALFAKNATIEPELEGYLRGFNLIVSYLFDPDGHFRASLERVGVKTLIECPHRVEEGKGHASVQLAKPLERLAMYLDGDAIFRFRSARPLGQARNPASQLVALHPGSGSLLKNWPVEHWIAFGREWMATHPHDTLALITGEAEAERGITAAVLEGWSGLRFEHWESLPLTELADRLTGCAAFLGHDSGTSHLAAACGLPCFLLFGPTHPALWAPRGADVRVLRAPGGTLSALPYAETADSLRHWFDALHQK
jgi:ADP-heptose:LPS heptosyltransferase